MPELQFAFGTYKGAVDAEGVRHGEGELLYHNGNHVKGEWVNGGLTGKGTKTFSNGDVYEGGFNVGKKEGTGTYTFKKGGTYQGGYMADKQHGQGQWSGHNGETYTGSYHNGLRNGTGTETITKGEQRTVYTGEWVRGEREGNGRLTLEDGAYWEGSWSKGKPLEGKQYTSNGEEVKPGVPENQQQQQQQQQPPSDHREMVEAVQALESSEGSPEAEAVRQNLLQAFQGIDAFGKNMANGLAKATCGLDALEAQLEDLSSALGIEGDDDFTIPAPADATLDSALQELSDLDILREQQTGGALKQETASLENREDVAGDPAVLARLDNLNSDFLTQV